MADIKGSKAKEAAPNATNLLDPNNAADKSKETVTPILRRSPRNHPAPTAAPIKKGKRKAPIEDIDDTETKKFRITDGRPGEMSHAIASLTAQPEIQLMHGHWRPTFQQTCVKNDKHCFYRAVAKAWIGDEEQWRQVWVRVAVLWNRVTTVPKDKTNTNAARVKRKLVYDFLAQKFPNLGKNLLEVDWKSLYATQITADALDVLIFINNPETISLDRGEWVAEDWAARSCGRQDLPPDRHIHLISWAPWSEHWTALTYNGDLGKLPFAEKEEHPFHFSPLLRLDIGDPQNRDLRPRDKRNGGHELDGRVANTVEMSKKAVRDLFAESDLDGYVWPDLDTDDDEGSDEDEGAEDGASGATAGDADKNADGDQANEKNIVDAAGTTNDTIDKIIQKADDTMASDGEEKAPDGKTASDADEETPDKVASEEPTHDKPAHHMAPEEKTSDG